MTNRARSGSLVILYFVYGLSFFALGVSLELQARVPSRLLSVRVIKSMAAFGFLHGIYEWSRIPDVSSNFVLIRPYMAWFQAAALAVLIASFSCLFAASIELLVDARALSRKAIFALPLWLAVIMFVFVQYWSLHRADANSEVIHVFESVVRYLFAFPVALTAAYAFFRSGQKHDRVYGSKLGPYLSMSSGVLLVYAVGTGLLQLGTPSHEPIRILHFRELVVIAIRTACALALTGLVSHAFVVETSKVWSQLDRLREEFVAFISHDARSSLSGALSGVELLKSRLLKQGDLHANLQLVELIQKNLRNSAGIIDDLFAVALTEIKQLPMQKVSFDLLRELRGLIERLNGMFPDRAITLVTSREEAVIQADPQRIEQVITNLITNAIKYSPPGSEVRVLVADQGDHIRIDVENGGEGIPRAELTHIFDRFYRVKGKPEAVSGTGLGLYIVKQLVEANNGSIRVESTPGKVTRFSVDLPRAA